MNPGIDPHFLTKNPMNIDRAVKDRLMLPVGCTKMLQTFLDIRDIIFKKIYPNSNISVPLLFVISLKDRLCNPEFSLNFFNSLSKRRNRIAMFDDGRHEILFDEEWPEVSEKIDYFIEEIEKRGKFLDNYQEVIPSLERS
jgi:alpha-beta hydrolase superfamily lysophospholipase